MSHVLLRSILNKIISSIFAFSASLKILSFEESVLLFEEQFKVNFLFLALMLISLICLEILCAVGLWQNNRLASKLSIALVIFFSTVVVLQLVLGVNNCGCFGTLIEISPSITLLKNMIILTLLTFILRRTGRNNAKEMV